MAIRAIMGITPIAITDRIPTMATITGLHITGTVGIGTITATIVIITTVTSTKRLT